MLLRPPEATDARGDSRPTVAVTVAVAVAVVAALAVVAPAGAQLAVTPPRLELDLAELEAGAVVRVANPSGHSRAVTVSVRGWELDAAGDVELLPPGAGSLEGWLRFGPARFVLEAGRHRAVRLAARPPAPPPVGEHRAMVLFDLVGDRARGLPAARFGVAVYCTVGQVERSGEIRAARRGSGGVEIEVAATGTAHVRPSGRYVVRSQAAPGEPSGAPVAEGPLPEAPVLPATSRWLALLATGDLGPGRWRVEVRGRIGESPVAAVLVLEADR